MRLRSREVIHALEAAYAVESAPDRWLAGVTDALRPTFPEAKGWCAYFVDASQPGTFRTAGYRYDGQWVMDGKGFERLERSTPTEIKAYMHLQIPFSYGSQVPRPPSLRRAVAATYDAHREREIFGINALDAAARGCSIVAALPQIVREPPLPPLRDTLSRLAAHIATGARILHQLDGGALLDGAAAVVSPNGRIEHAEADATSRTAREALRDAAMQIDRARTRGARLEADRVTSTWQALVAGRWSLVDSFERGGRRYYVARNNRPQPVSRAEVLSERETAVVSAAALGHSNKMVAYELGISLSSVATHLRRAAVKLGAASRGELIVAFAEWRQR